MAEGCSANGFDDCVARAEAVEVMGCGFHGRKRNKRLFKILPTGPGSDGEDPLPPIDAIPTPFPSEPARAMLL